MTTSDGVDLEWDTTGKTGKKGGNAQAERRGLACLGVGAVLSLIAFRWGNQLLGLPYAMGYAGLTFLVVLSLAACLARTERPSYAGAAVVAILSVPLAYAMIFPASINSDFKIVIEKQATALAARGELDALFASDPAFGDLSVSTSTYGKGVEVTIRGTLGDGPDLVRLLARIGEGCQVVNHGAALCWDVKLRSSGQRIIDPGWFDD